jgi:hypothetical protein
MIPTVVPPLAVSVTVSIQQRLLRKTRLRTSLTNIPLYIPAPDHTPTYLRAAAIVPPRKEWPAFKRLAICLLPKIRSDALIPPPRFILPIHYCSPMLKLASKHTFTLAQRCACKRVCVLCLLVLFVHASQRALRLLDSIQRASIRQFRYLMEKKKKKRHSCVLCFAVGALQ